jgi:hypothetical protein
MRYPVLPRGAASELAQALLGDEAPSIEDHLKWEGHGPRLDVSEVEGVSEKLRQRLTEFQKSDQRTDVDHFEGSACGEVHTMLRSVPMAVIDDPGFWRYLSIAHFWWLATWRHQSTFLSGDPAQYMRYVDGVHQTECVLTRMYLRAQIAEVDGDYSLASAVPQGSDFWRSHILRVSTGSSPKLAQALIREQLDQRMPTDEVRALARDLNRVSSNVVLSVYSSEDASSLISELRHGDSAL